MTSMVSKAVAFAGATLLWAGSAGLAQACIPPLPRTDAQIAADDLIEQTYAWDRAVTVYLATVVDVASIDRPLSPLLIREQSHRVSLRADRVLKGELEPDGHLSQVTVRVICGVWSDLARGSVGDQFVIYADPSGASDRSGAIALRRISHPATLSALEP